MGETFCGKRCEVCAQREEQMCSGCKNGSEGRFGDCEIASCCVEKGYENCSTCTGQTGCFKLLTREEMPNRRQELLEAQTARQQRYRETAPLLGKWLWILFWLILVGEIPALMTQETVVALLPQLRLPGEIFRCLCYLGCTWCLWKLHDVEKQYGRAAIFMLMNAVLTLITELATGGDTSTRLGLTLLLLLPDLVVSLCVTYFEYTAHAAVLDGLDDELAGKWRRLWKWEIGFLIGLVGCTLLVIFSATLALLALIVAGIGVIVVAILKMVYLYRMAKRFRNEAEEESRGLADEAAV